MENLLSDSRSGVAIEITAPSAANSEDEMEEEFIPRAVIENSKQDEMNNFSDSSAYEGNISQENVENSHEGPSNKEDDLSRNIESDLSLQDEDDSKSSESNTKDDDSKDQKPANLEMVGDRVLIEKDGKFELVDVSEIKAEYFEMLGLSSSEHKDSIDGKAALLEGDVSEEKRPTQQEEKEPERPKTTINESRRQTRNSSSPPRRTISAKLNRSRSDEYAHIKSIYGLTEDQLKVKKKREEAIAKRKKEEKKREEAEQRRKREDAEAAFQAWLAAKLEEARERRQEEAKNRPDPSLEQRKREDAESAYEEWLASKKRQGKVSRQYEERRQSEEAGQFVIRDRQLCDEAFKSWMRKKRAEAKAKELLKKKRKPKPKPKKKESLPLNSKNITYLEYYGYRNNVVL